MFNSRFLKIKRDSNYNFNKAQYLRLDANERTISFSTKDLKLIKKSISDYNLQAYPTDRETVAKIISKKDLAKNAIHIEQNIINENVGSQDQVATSYGGLNKIKFNNDNSFNVEKIIIHPQRYKELDDNLLLFFTGTTRFASTIAEEQIKNIKNTSNQINEMVEMVDHSISILRNNDSIDEFGKLLNKSWVLKKTLSTKISNNLIDNIYETALSNGALGGKLLGAGGGGFILFYVPKKKQKAVRQALDKLNNVPFNFDNQGSSIVLYEPNGL